MSISSSPFENINRLFNQMSRQFEEASRAWQEGEPMTAVGMQPLSTDVVEHDEAFAVTVDLPGFDADDVDVSIRDQTLHIDATRKREEAEETTQYVRRERSHRRFHRDIRFPATVDPDEVSASMQTGVLVITVPKAEPAQGREIDIS